MSFWGERKKLTLMADWIFFSSNATEWLEVLAGCPKRKAKGIRQNI
jgi:hypothetical protein